MRIFWKAELSLIKVRKLLNSVNFWKVREHSRKLRYFRKLRELFGKFGKVSGDSLELRETFRKFNLLWISKTVGKLLSITFGKFEELSKGSSKLRCFFGKFGKLLGSSGNSCKSWKTRKTIGNLEKLPGSYRNFPEVQNTLSSRTWRCPEMLLPIISKQYGLVQGAPEVSLEKTRETFQRFV